MNKKQGGNSAPGQQQFSTIQPGGGRYDDQFVTGAQVAPSHQQQQYASGGYSHRAQHLASSGHDGIINQQN